MDTLPPKSHISVHARASKQSISNNRHFNILRTLFDIYPHHSDHYNANFPFFYFITISSYTYRPILKCCFMFVSFFWNYVCYGPQNFSLPPQDQPLLVITNFIVSQCLHMNGNNYIYIYIKLFIRCKYFEVGVHIKNPIKNSYQDGLGRTTQTLDHVVVVHILI